MESTNDIQHILLADDDKDHAVLFERMIKKEYPSIKISYVNDGEQLLYFLHLHKVDLLFLDLNMPCKNGHECLLEIRKESALKDLPIVVYSSSAHMSDIQKSFLYRADFYLVKPFITEHLRTALKAILSVNWNEGPFIKNHYFINNRFVPYIASA
jgi:CheY-like chemotaxis protein